MESLFVSAPGKVILFGEHAVVHKKAAVATSVSLRSYLLVQIKNVPHGYDPCVTLNFRDIGLNHTWLLSELPPRPPIPEQVPTSLDEELIKSIEPLLEPFSKKEFEHAAVLTFLYLYLSLYTRLQADITFTLRSAIPIGSGLGSSASISVCLATALLTIGGHVVRPNPERDQVDVLKTINSWAFLGERCIHGNPSGVDNTVATFGGGVIFRKAISERRLSNGTFAPPKPAEKVIVRIPPLRFLLTDTNQPRRTADLIARVAKLMMTLPGVTTHILTAIDGIAAEARRLLELDENITERLGELMSINQGLLNAIGVGHEKLDTVARLTKEIGWTKLTGAGGGGCALTLLREDVEPGTLRQVQQSIRDQGFKPFGVELGGKGVGILENVSEAMIEEFQHEVGCVAKEDNAWVFWD